MATQIQASGPPQLIDVLVNDGFYPLDALPFNPEKRECFCTVNFDVLEVAVSAIPAIGVNTVKIKGFAITTFGESTPVRNLIVGKNAVPIIVVANTPNRELNSYHLFVTRLPQDVETNYDTTITFADAFEKNEPGEGNGSFNSGALNATLKFSYDLITPQLGAPCTMTIRVNDVEVLVVNFSDDYIGKGFTLLLNGNHYTGQFINNTIDF